MKEWIQKWRYLGVKKNDILLIHSHMKRIFIENREKNWTPRLVVEALLEVAGTLLFPLFNFDFTKGIPFDLQNTPSHMGALTEEARQYPGVIRTGHPLYSFAALGDEASLFKGIDNTSGYGKDSPFALLHQRGGKIGIIDLTDQECMTFYHYIEEQNQVPYREYKTFEGLYTDSHGITTQRAYSLYVRKKGVITSLKGAEEFLWKEKLYQGKRAGVEEGLRLIEAPLMFESISRLISEGKALNHLYQQEIL